MPITISNTRHRTDTTGNPVDCHDGCLHYFNNRYYLYGTAYGKSTGYTYVNRLRIYSSPDLSMDNWTNHGDALDFTPQGLHARSYLLYNPLTRKYVMWFNYFTGWIGEKNWARGDGPIKPVVHRVAVSDSPAGPFHVVTERASTRYDHVGDLTLFRDSDNSAYLAYDASGYGFPLTIEKLNDDYTNTTTTRTEPIAWEVEAPALFKRGQWYYLLFDKLCCYCPQGTGARVYRAKHPLGPWEYRNNINRTNSTDPTAQIIIPAQQTYVANLPTVSSDTFIWIADRWQTGGAPNRGADLQYWSEPLQFTPDGDIQPLRWQDQWQLTHTNLI